MDASQRLFSLDRDSDQDKNISVHSGDDIQSEDEHMSSNEEDKATYKDPPAYSGARTLSSDIVAKVHSILARIGAQEIINLLIWAAAESYSGESFCRACVAPPS